MSKLPGTNLQKTVIAVCLLFIFLVALSIGQYQIISQHRKIASVSSRILFQFNTVKEIVNRALLDKRYADLGDTVGELEDLNASVQGILQNPLIPDQLKSALLNRMDLSGMAILVRQVNSFADPVKISRLQEEIRISGDQILQFDRLLAEHVKKKLVGYQSFVIGMLLFAVLFLAHVCFFVYLRLISPLKKLKLCLARLAEEAPQPMQKMKNYGWLQEIAVIAQAVEKRQREMHCKTDLLSAALGNCPFPLMVCDSQGKIILQNGVAKEVFSTLPAVSFGSVFALLADDKARQIFKDSLAEMATEHGGQKALRLAWGGSEKKVTLFTIPGMGNETLFGMFWQTTEDSDPDRSELPFSFRLALLGQLTCGVAHEIGDSVNSLLNYQDLALDSLNNGQCGAEGVSMLRAAAAEGEKIAQRTRLLLETSQFRSMADTFPVAQLLNETVNLVRNQMKSEGIRIEVFLPPDLPLIKCCFGMARLVCIEILLFVGELFASFSEKRIEIRATSFSSNDRQYVRLVVESPISGRFLLADNEKSPKNEQEKDQVSSWQCLRLLQEYLRREGGDIQFASLDSGTRMQVDFPTV